MRFIRQNATHKVVLGPFVDKTDGFTPETGITLSGADEAEAIRHDSATVVDISAYTWAAITTMDGYYNLTLQTGITDTVGHLVIAVHDDSVCLPVRAEFTVIEEAVYDALFASAADLHTAAISDIESSLVIVKSDLVITTSDTAAIHSDTTIIASDIVVLDNAISDVESSLVIIKSDLVVATSDTAAIESELIVVHSDTTAIHSDTTIIASDVVEIYSDTTAIHSETTVIASDVVVLDAAVSDVESSLVIVKSDLVIATSDLAVIESDTSAIHSDTTIIASDIVALNNISVNDILTTQMTEAYAPDGTAPTLAQAIFLIQQTIGDFAISGTTITVKKLDGSTTAATYTLDDGTSPTSRTRAT